MKFLKISLLVSLVLLLAAPGVLYLFGLSRVEGRPQPPAVHTLGGQQQAGASHWQRIEQTGELPQLPRFNPWSFTYHWLMSSEPDGTFTLAILSRNHNRARMRDHRVASWHLAGAAMSIWISRHWSREQVLAELHRLYGER